MPFDAAGNFSRSYNFTQDRDNGIKILASHVDGEFDNFATGMNAVFFRDGRVPMQADLRLNINGITGLKDGALGSPAIKFNTDANTGVYMPGLNQFGIQVNAVQRGVFTTAGFDVTGAFTATGNVSAGVAFFEGGTQLNAKYASLSGGNTFAGAQTATTFTTSGVNGAFFPAPRDGTVGSPVLYSPTANNFKVFLNGADRLSMSDTAFTVNPTATFNSRVTVNGSGGGSAFIIDDHTNTAGANLQFTGNGAVTPNKTIRVNAGTMEWTNSAYSAIIMSLFDNGNLSMNGTMLTVNNSKWQAQHDGADAYVRSNTGDMYLGAGGNNVLKVQAGGAVTNLSSGGYFANQGAGGAYGVGFSNQRTGRVGFHMYNGGGVTEWVTYQPAGGTGHEYRIAKGASGSLTDAWYLNTAGDMYALGHASIGNEIWVGGNSGGSNTGVIRFGSAGAASTKYLFYDGSQFQLSASLAVGGNITSSSDARLKSNVRDFENGLAIVRALKPKRFDMYGKADFGFVAQEVQQVLPEAVSTGKDGMLGVDYGRLTAPLAAAIQALNNRLDRAGL